MNQMHCCGFALQSTGPLVARSGSSYEPPPPHACSVKTRKSAEMMREMFMARRIGANPPRAYPPKVETP